MQLVYKVYEPTSRERSTGGAVFFTVSELTSRELLAGDAACLEGFRTFLQGTVSRRCSLFLLFLNLPPGDCWPGVRRVYTVTEPTSGDLFTCGAACL